MEESKGVHPEPNEQIITYITGFLYDSKNRFLLLRKEKGPRTVVGKLTGIGGKVEPTDFFPTDAIDREVKEEMGSEFEFEWQTVGLIECEGQFNNIIFQAKVEDLTSYNLPSRNDVGEKFELHTTEDILLRENCGLGVKSIVALLVYENPSSDRIEITRYKTNVER